MPSDQPVQEKKQKKALCLPDLPYTPVSDGFPDDYYIGTDEPDLDDLIAGVSQWFDTAHMEVKLFATDRKWVPVPDAKKWVINRATGEPLGLVKEEPKAKRTLKDLLNEDI